MGRGCLKGPGPANASALAGGVAAWAPCIEGDGSGEGTCALTAVWFDGRMLRAGEVGTGGGGIGFEAVREAVREWDAGLGSVLMSGIVAVRFGELESQFRWIPAWEPIESGCALGP